MVLTKEEKKAKKEAKKLEKLRAMEEARKKMKLDELKREVTFQAKTKDELDRTWREALLKIQEPILKQNIEVLWHTFERAYDKKDYVINKLVTLMNVADDQFQRTVSSFCVILDGMINKFLSDLDAISKENDKQTAKLLQRGENEADQITADNVVAETHLQLLIYHGHTTADSLIWTRRGENLVKEDEDRNKYLDERDQIISLLENVYNNMWDDYKAVLKVYITTTAENQKQLRKLRRKEEIMADVIMTQGRKIANSDGLLKRLRTELAAYESGTKQAVFRDRRNRHRKACFCLKKRLINGCALDAKQLAVLVRVSDEAVDRLVGAHKKAEKILRLAALCRKLETQREKVLPLGTVTFSDPEDDKSSARPKSSNDGLISNSLSATSGLGTLWQRISKAELIRRALLREKYILEHENAIMSQMLRENENEYMQPETNACLCNKNKKSSASRPVAIEGVFEMSKIEKLKRM